MLWSSRSPESSPPRIDGITKVSCSTVDVTVAGAPIPVKSPARPDAETASEKLTRRGIAYLSARYGVSMLVNVGNMLVLTWWIGPHAYGIFVTAVGLTTFLSSLTRFGTDTYLVRCKTTPT